MKTSKHGGNLTHLMNISGLPADKILDFSANINPMGLPDWLRPVVSSALESIIHYPDPESSNLVAATTERYKCSPDQVLVGNGSSEILHLLPRALGKPRALIPAPSYSDYFSACEAAGLDVEILFLDENSDFVPDIKRLESSLRGDELVFVCSPNNPTGLLIDTEALRQLANRNPSTFFVVDEAFGDFVDGFDSITLNRPRNVLVLLSLTKIFSVPGLRLGCAICEPEIVASVKLIQPTWSVNSIAQAVGSVALRDRDYVDRSRRLVNTQRQILEERLRAIDGLTIYPGRANFLLVRIDRQDMDAIALSNRMLTDGIAIRVCDNFHGLDKRFFRVAVKAESQNDRLIESLGKALGILRKPSTKRKVPAIMFQGTSSNAGKSVLTAALGRILLQDGYRVAPFKSQNMSLNSFVTISGGEMGRAQVTQAQACRLDPDVRMNPILLKPNSDTGSQVIVMGKPVGNMDVIEYVRYKPQAFDVVKAAYDSLAQDYDVIVLEGAGSPGEVNLKHHDIVNMQMARYAEAPVLLVGDIDRGGVFASFVGTMEVLSEWERSLVSGFVVNRFRGNKDLLADAHNYTLRHTGKPVLGVVPYFHDLGLPEEDSVSFKNGLFNDSTAHDDSVEIAIIDLPHISNFTDFDALRAEPDVALKIVKSPSDLNQPDAIILPGSKNTIGDLTYLQNTGIQDRLKQLAEQGVELVGVCGGFQMLGRGISDPHCLESDGKTFQGLGFLDVTTVLAHEKTLTRATCAHIESGLPVHGYEIHHGKSSGANVEPVLRMGSGSIDGAKSQDGKIWGTYLHGIFDADEFRRWFIDRLRQRRGLEPKRKVMAIYDLEPALDRLADAVRKSLDMERIYGIIGL